jgi:DnaJ-class molecular chaperone
MSTLYCAECSGRGRVTFDRPNDPCARLEPCDVCHGTGEAHCHICGALAVDAVVIARSFQPLCERHFAEHQAEVEA